MWPSWWNPRRRQDDRSCRHHLRACCGRRSLHRARRGLRDHDRDGVRVGFRTDTFAGRRRLLARPDPGGRRGGGAVHGEQPDRDETVTGNIGVRRRLANWGVVYLGNAIGALSVVAMVYIGEWWRGDVLGIGVTALSTAAVKTSLPFFVVLARGILANALVCLAVWLAAAGRSVID